MKRFYISIKKGDAIFMGINKKEFALDPSWNIAKQAEAEVDSLIGFCMPDEADRKDISWKVYFNEGGRFMFMTRSINWVD